MNIQQWLERERAKNDVTTSDVVSILANSFVLLGNAFNMTPELNKALALNNAQHVANDMQLRKGVVFNVNGFQFRVKYARTGSRIQRFAVYA